MVHRGWIRTRISRHRPEHTNGGGHGGTKAHRICRKLPDFFFFKWHMTRFLEYAVMCTLGYRTLCSTTTNIPSTMHCVYPMGYIYVQLYSSNLIRASMAYHR